MVVFVKIHNAAKHVCKQAVNAKVRLCATILFNFLVWVGSSRLNIISVIIIIKYEISI